MREKRNIIKLLLALLLFVLCGVVIGFESFAFSSRNIRRFGLIGIALIVSLLRLLRKRPDQCPHCGKLQNHSGGFCPHCGNKLS